MKFVAQIAALSLLGASAAAAQPVGEAPRWSLAIHGGAGVIERTSLTPEQDAAYRAALQKALDAGSTVLEAGGSALDAVQAAIQLMEDDPLFNAGRGAVFTADATHEMDACVMRGHDLACGSIAGVSTVRNPVIAAKALMEAGGPVFMIGAAAEQFA